MFCGFPLTLLDQLKVNGGSPDVIKAVIVPPEPVPQEVGYKLKLTFDEIGNAMVPICWHPK